MKNRRILCLLSNKERELKGIKGIIKIEINIARGGVRKDRVKLVISVEIRFLLKSLIASLKGCKIPMNPTLFGPFRIWM